MNTEPPRISLHLGEQIPGTKKPILGVRRIAKVLAVCNAVLRLRIVEGDSNRVFISPVGGLIIQIKRAVESSGGAGGWRGAFDPSADPVYTFGQMVYVTPAQAETFVDGEDNQITLAGTYVWNSQTDWTGGEIPIHTLMPDYDVNKWFCIGTYQQEVPDCDENGNPITRAMDSQIIPEQEEE